MFDGMADVTIDECCRTADTKDAQAHCANGMKIGVKATPSIAITPQRMHVGSYMQDLAIVDEGWGTEPGYITSCQLIVNIASWCTRLRTLAFNGNVLRTRHNDGEAFPSAVSRLTALESLALHNLNLLVRSCETAL